LQRKPRCVLNLTIAYEVSTVHYCDICITYCTVQDEVLQLKKIAFKNAKEVKKFWIKINKVVAFKQKLDAAAVRQKVWGTVCFNVALFFKYDFCITI
jgi:hypothetical protein